MYLIFLRNRLQINVSDLSDAVKQTTIFIWVFYVDVKQNRFGLGLFLSIGI